MKVYKALIYDDGTTQEVLYECDHEKNKQCEKTLCQSKCKHTKDIQYAKDIYNQYMNDNYE